MNLTDFLNKGVSVPNPNYTRPSKKNPAGSPKFITSNDVNDAIGFESTLGKLISKNSYDLTHLDNEHNKYSEYGVYINPINTEEELKLERAKNQSGFKQFGNFLVQSLGNEVVLGSIKGLFDIADLAINIGTKKGEDDYTNPVSKVLEEAQDYIRDKFAIYHENPNESFAFGDFGWWTDNAVSIFSSLSMLIPSTGIVKGAGLLSKLAKTGKLGKIGKVASQLVTAEKYKVASDIGKLANTKNTEMIAKSMNYWGEITATAALSRTAENYIEARDTYKNVYENTLTEIKNMDDTKRKDMLERNPQLKGKSDEEIAKYIASVSADETFAKDYWMMMFDVMQYRAISSLWKGTAKNVTTAATRNAQKNAIAELAPKTLEETGETIAKKELTWLGKRWDNIKYSFKHPTKSVMFAELHEGVEEAYQAIYQEKGEEVGKQMIDSSFTPRTLESYLSDPEVWEQAFWGWIGGIAFQGVGSVYGDAINKIKNKRLEKKLANGEISKQEFELNQLTYEKQQLAEINSRKAIIDKFIANMQTVNSGRLPGHYKRDKTTGEFVIDENGEPELEELTDDEKEIVKSQLINDFLTKKVISEANAGTYDMFRAYIGSKEFNDYLDKARLNNSENKSNQTLSSILLDRIDKTYELYNNTLNKIVNSINDSNHYVAKLIASKITNDRLTSDDIQDSIDSINNKIPIEDSEIAEQYKKIAVLEQVNREINKIDSILNRIKAFFDAGEISQAAYNKYKKDYNKEKKRLYDWIESYGYHSFNSKYDITYDNDGNEIRRFLSKVFKEDEYSVEFRDLYNNVIRNDNIEINGVNQNTANIINKNTKNLVDSVVALENGKHFKDSNIPNTQQELEDIYDEFNDTLNNITRKRYDEAAGRVEEYVKSFEDVEDGIRSVLRGSNVKTGEVITGQLKEDLDLLKLGHASTKEYLQGLRKLKNKITTERTQEENRNDEEIARNQQVVTNGQQPQTQTQQQAAQQVITNNLFELVFNETYDSKAINDYFENEYKNIPEIKEKLDNNTITEEEAKQAAIDDLKDKVDRKLRFYLHLLTGTEKEYNDVRRGIIPDTIKLENNEEVTLTQNEKAYIQHLANTLQLSINRQTGLNRYEEQFVEKYFIEQIAPNPAYILSVLARTKVYFGNNDSKNAYLYKLCEEYFNPAKTTRYTLWNSLNSKKGGYEFTQKEIDELNEEGLTPEQYIEQIRKKRTNEENFIADNNPTKKEYEESWELVREYPLTEEQKFHISDIITFTVNGEEFTDEITGIDDFGAILTKKGFILLPHAVHEFNGLIIGDSYKSLKLNDKDNRIINHINKGNYAITEIDKNKHTNVVNPNNNTVDPNVAKPAVIETQQPIPTVEEEQAAKVASENIIDDNEEVIDEFHFMVEEFLTPEEEFKNLSEEEKKAIAQQNLDIVEDEREKANIDLQNFVINLQVKDKDIFNRLLQINDTNDSVYKQVLDKIKDHLTTRGYSDEVINDIAVKGFLEALNNTKALLFRTENLLYSVYDKLINIISSGMEVRHSSIFKLSSTEINEVVKQFVEEYIKKNGLEQTTNGFYIIDIVKLFEDIQKEIIERRKKGETINENAAIYLLYNMKDFINNPDNATKYIFKNKRLLDNTAKNPHDFVHKIIKELAVLTTKKTISDNHHISSPTKKTQSWEEAVLKARKGDEVHVILENGSISFVNSDGVELGYLATVIPTGNGTNNTFRINKLLKGFLYEVGRDSNGNFYDINFDNFILGIINTPSKEFQAIRKLLEEYNTEKTFLAELNANEKAQYFANPNKICKLDINRAIAFMNTPAVRNLLANGAIRLPNNLSNDIDKTRYILKEISNIIYFNGSGLSNAQYINAYNEWKERVFNNYTKTRELQDLITKKQQNGEQVYVSIEFANNFTPAYNNKQLRDINDAELGFTREKNHIVYFIDDNTMVDEAIDTGQEKTYENKTVGRANDMGILLDTNANENETCPAVALIKDGNYIGTSSTPLPKNAITKEDVIDEIVGILEAYQTADMNGHDNAFDEAYNALASLMGGYDSTSNSSNRNYMFIGYSVVKTSNAIFVNYYKQNKPIITIHKYRKGEINGKKVTGTGISYNEKGDPTKHSASYKPDKAFLTKIAKDIVSGLKYNRTFYTYKKRNVDNDLDATRNRYMYKKDGKLVVQFTGKPAKVYDNFTHFALTNNAFKTNQDVVNGSLFVLDKNNADIYVNIDTIKVKATKASPKQVIERANKRNSVSSKEILEAAGVKQSTIDFLLNNDLIFDKTYYDRKGTGYEAKFEKGRFYWAPRGVTAANSSQTELLRIMIHEKIHKHAADNKVYDKPEVIDAVLDTYDAFVQAVNEDIANNTIDIRLKAYLMRLIDGLNNIKNNKSSAEFVDEWITEALTRKEVINYLNGKEYKAVNEKYKNANTKASEIKNKSIFQKIIDLIVQFFTNNIKDSSILARQYVIFSEQLESNIDNNTAEESKEDIKSDNAKDDTTKANTTASDVTDNDNSPVEGGTPQTPTDPATTDPNLTSPTPKAEISDELLKELGFEDTSKESKPRTARRNVRKIDRTGYRESSIGTIETEQYTEEEQQILANAPRNEQGQLLAPNGKVSNLTERQYAQVRTKAFKRWFGDWEKSTIIPISFMPKKHWKIGTIINTPEETANICDNTQIKTLNSIISQFGKPNQRGTYYAKPIIIWAKSPINDSQIHHSTVAVRINGKIYLYDMPQSEYIEYVDFNKGKIISNYIPRLIEYNKENLIKYYNTREDLVSINDETIMDDNIIELPISKSSKIENASDILSELSIDAYIGRETINNSDNKYIGSIHLDNLPEFTKYIDSHGIAKDNELQRLLDLLNNGIDTSRSLLYTAPLGKGDDTTAAGAAIGTHGGTSYRHGLFIIAADPNETLNDNGIGTVLINDMSETKNELGYKVAIKLRDYLQKHYPNVDFILYSQAKDYYETNKSINKKIRQDNISKTVDENGEPLTVYINNDNFNTENDDIRYSSIGTIDETFLDAFDNDDKTNPNGYGRVMRMEDLISQFPIIEQPNIANMIVSKRIKFVCR